MTPQCSPVQLLFFSLISSGRLDISSMIRLCSVFSSSYNPFQCRTPSEIRRESQSCPAFYLLLPMLHFSLFFSNNYCLYFFHYIIIEIVQNVSHHLMLFLSFTSYVSLFLLLLFLAFFYLRFKVLSFDFHDEDSYYGVGLDYCSASISIHFFFCHWVEIFCACSSHPSPYSLTLFWVKNYLLSSALRKLDSSFLKPDELFHTWRNIHVLTGYP